MIYRYFSLQSWNTRRIRNAGGHGGGSLLDEHIDPDYQPTEKEARGAWTGMTPRIGFKKKWDDFNRFE